VKGIVVWEELDLHMPHLAFLINARTIYTVEFL